MALAEALRKSANIAEFYIDGELISGKGLLALATAVNERGQISNMNICLNRADTG